MNKKLIIQIKNELYKIFKKEKSESILSVLTSCTNQKDFRENHWNTYLCVKRQSTIWPLVEKLLPKLNTRKKYTDQQVVETCNLAQNLTELRTKYVNFYVIALNRGLQDKIPVISEQRNDSHTTSIGEETLRNFFSIIFEKQFPSVRPEFLKGNKKRNLELDGYSEELKIAFEHQGAHHYRDTRRSSLSEVRLRDSLKKELCLQHRVKLITVPCLVEFFRLDQDKIKHHLIDQFTQHNISIPQKFYITPVTTIFPEKGKSWTSQSILIELIRLKSYNNLKVNSLNAYIAMDRLNIKNKITSKFIPNSYVSTEELAVCFFDDLDKATLFLKSNKIEKQLILLDYKELAISNYENLLFIRQELNSNCFLDNFNQIVSRSTVDQLVLSGEIPVFDSKGVRIEKSLSSPDNIFIFDKFKDIHFNKTEHLIVPLLLTSLSYKEIGIKINKSTGCIKDNTSKIYKKIKMNRTELIQLFYKNHLDESKISALTATEKEIVHLLYTHSNTKEIAMIKKITEKSIKFHLNNIYKKMRCRNKLDLFNLLNVKSHS